MGSPTLGIEEFLREVNTITAILSSDDELEYEFGHRKFPAQPPDKYNVNLTCKGG